MDDALLTIGDVARLAGVATSSVRFYERRGLLAADARRSGQRRYRVASLRRLVFIGMLQDAGLTLEDIRGVLDATDVDEWKTIARERLTALDAAIAQLQLAREYLAGALLCRYDHPATDCQIMGAEIDRRLTRRGGDPSSADVEATTSPATAAGSAVPRRSTRRTPAGRATRRRRGSVDGPAQSVTDARSYIDT